MQNGYVAGLHLLQLKDKVVYIQFTKIQTFEGIVWISVALHKNIFKPLHNLQCQHQEVQRLMIDERPIQCWLFLQSNNHQHRDSGNTTAATQPPQHNRPERRLVCPPKKQKNNGMRCSWFWGGTSGGRVKCSREQITGPAFVEVLPAKRNTFLH